jgi:hypothetical protein
MSAGDDNEDMERIAGNDQVTVELYRSGFIDWNTDGDYVIVILPVLVLINWLTNLIRFRGSWTIRVYAAGSKSLRPIRKVRYRNKAEALADVDRHIALGSAPQVPPNGPEQPSTTPDH